MESAGSLYQPPGGRPRYEKGLAVGEGYLSAGGLLSATGSVLLFVHRMESFILQVSTDREHLNAIMSRVHRSFTWVLITPLASLLYALSVI